MTISDSNFGDRAEQNLPVDYETYIENERLTCTVEAAIRVISGRWKVLIIRELLSDSKQFNELHRALYGISHKVLTQQLRDMEGDDIIDRHVDQTSSIRRVTYSLTPLGRSLHPIIHDLHQWGLDYLNR